MRPIDKETEAVKDQIMQLVENCEDKAGLWLLLGLENWIYGDEKSAESTNRMNWEHRKKRDLREFILNDPKHRADYLRKVPEWIEANEQYTANLRSDLEFYRSGVSNQSE